MSHPVSEDDTSIFFFSKDKTVSVSALRKNCSGFTALCEGETSGDTGFRGPANPDPSRPIFKIAAYKDIPLDVVDFIIGLIEQSHTVTDINTYFESLARNNRFQSVSTYIVNILRYLIHEEAMLQVRNDGIAHVCSGILTGTFGVPHNHRGRPKTIISQLSDVYDIDDSEQSENRISALRKEILASLATEVIDPAEEQDEEEGSIIEAN